MRIKEKKKDRTKEGKKDNRSKNGKKKSRNDERKKIKNGWMDEKEDRMEKKKK